MAKKHNKESRQEYNQAVIKKSYQSFFIYIYIYIYVCKTTLSRCTNYSKAFANLDNTQSSLFTVVYCRTEKMREILING